MPRILSTENKEKYKNIWKKNAIHLKSLFYYFIQATLLQYDKGSQKCGRFAFQFNF